MNKIEQIADEMKLYRHITSGKVMFSEVDMFSVVHNIRYFYWLENARTEYMNELTGMNLAEMAAKDHSIYMVVHSDIDYFGPARYMDEYEILTRISLIKNSSLKFENIIRLKNGTPIAKASSVIVHVNTKTLEKIRIPDSTRAFAVNYETVEFPVME